MSSSKIAGPTIDPQRFPSAPSRQSPAQDAGRTPATSRENGFGALPPVDVRTPAVAKEPLSVQPAPPAADARSPMRSASKKGPGVLPRMDPSQRAFVLSPASLDQGLAEQNPIAAQREAIENAAYIGSAFGIPALTAEARALRNALDGAGQHGLPSERLDALEKRTDALLVGWLHSSEPVMPAQHGMGRGAGSRPGASLTHDSRPRLHEQALIAGLKRVTTENPRLSSVFQQTIDSVQKRQSDRELSDDELVSICRTVVREARHQDVDAGDLVAALRTVFSRAHGASHSERISRDNKKTRDAVGAKTVKRDDSAQHRSVSKQKRQHGQLARQHSDFKRTLRGTHRQTLENVAEKKREDSEQLVQTRLDRRYDANNEDAARYDEAPRVQRDD